MEDCRVAILAELPLAMAGYLDFIKEEKKDNVRSRNFQARSKK
jgi:hypothetical protein